MLFFTQLSRPLSQIILLSISLSNLIFYLPLPAFEILLSLSFASSSEHSLIVMKALSILAAPSAGLEPFQEKGVNPRAPPRGGDSKDGSSRGGCKRPEAGTINPDHSLDNEAYVKELNQRPPYPADGFHPMRDSPSAKGESAVYVDHQAGKSTSITVMTCLITQTRLPIIMMRTLSRKEQVI